MEVLAMASACSQYLLERLNEVLIMKCCSNPVSNRTPMKSFRLQKLNDNLVQKLNTALLSANAVAHDAEEKEYQNPTVKVWLNELKDAVYRADDLLDEIFTEDLQNSLDAESQTKKSQVCKPQSFHRRKGNRTKHIKRTMEDTLHRLKDIVKNIDSIGLKERVYSMKLSPRMSTSLVKKDQVFGRNGDTEEIIDLLLSGCGRPGLSVIRIVGMGGIGKTALAQLVYNDYRVWENFDLRAWVCISEYTNPFSATKVILESITSECCYLSNLDLLQVRLREVLMGRRFFLVLDDMWNDKYNDWEVLQAPFNDGVPGSCVIITTRSHRVPAMKSTVYTHVYTHIMQPLSDEDSWNLFVTSAFGDEEPRSYKLEDIGREIVHKCSGLPLAIKTIGNILGSKQILNEWQDCLQRLSFPSEEMPNVFSTIKLSYDALPAYLKQCFAYCSIFPKGYEFVKEKLVLLWMAEGLLQLPGENRRMEEVGDEYFRELVLRSFLFQTSENTSKYVMPDLWNNTSRFVMHDLLNDLAVSVAGEYCFSSKEFSRISARTRHLSVSNCSTSMILEDVCNVKFLRTFLLLDHKSCYLSSNELQTLSKLQFLRVLSLSHHPINKLPDSICNLIHLRYVDLSHSALNMLPNSVCALCNLQTLILSNCEHLTELPKTMWKLINLRHLDINETKLREMPKKMSRLENLGTLPYFVVNKESGSTVKELGGLLYLHGALRISKLQNVVSPDAAAEAGLADKRYLDELVLEWGDDTVDPLNASSILERLMPHTNLKRLSINFYSGIIFPNWLGDFSFSNMVFLHLRKCKNCLQLPPLGQLPSLKVLIIEGMTAVVSVGPEFYRRDMPLKCFESPKFKDIPFKSLETLTFDKMLEWKEWTSSEGGEFPNFEGREFPCLQKLCIRKCPKLKGILPKQPCSLEIEIDECEFLSRHTPEVKLHKKPSHSLSMTQGNISAVKFSSPLTEVVTESSLPLTQGAVKSSLPLTEVATESSLPQTQSATESTLPMTQGKVAKTLKESSETEGKGESEEEIDKGPTTSETKATKHKEKESIEEYRDSSLFSDEDSPLPPTQGAIESSLLPPTEGATESSLTMAEGTVDNSLPIAECIIDSSLTMTQGSVAKTLKETTKMEGRGQTEEKISLEIATTSESKWTKQEQKVFMEEDPSCSLYSDEKSSLSLTQGTTESSFPMAEGAVHTSLPMAEGVVDTSLPMTQGKVAKTLKESLETEGRGKAEEEIGLEIATASKTKGTKQEQKEFIKEDPFPSLLSDEESLLPPTQGATKSSLPMAESVVDTSLPTTQDQNSTFPSTQGATESSLSIVEGVVETSLPMTQGKVAMTLKEILEGQGREEADEKIGLEISTTSETKLTKQEEKEFIKEDPYPSSLLSDENSSLPMAQSVVDTPLLMTQDEKSSLPSTQGAVESSFARTQGATESSFAMAQGAIDALLSKTQGRMRSTSLIKKLKESTETDVDIETTFDAKGIKLETEESKKEDPSLFSEDQLSLPTTQEPRESLFLRSQTPNSRDEADVWTNTRSSQDGVHDLSSFESMKVSEISELMKLPRQVHSLKIEGCDDLKFIPEEVMDLEPPLKHLYIINCCSLESFPKDHPPIALKILYIRNCKKLDFPLTKEKTHQDALLEYLCIGSSCDSLKFISLDLFPMLTSLSIWDCENLKSLSMPEGIPKNLAFLEALEIRDCPNLDTFPKGGLPTPNLKSIWLSNCNNLKRLPDQLQTLDSLQSMFLNNCPELESLSKKDFPSSLSLLSITFCSKLRLGTEWGLNELQYLSRLEIEGISVNAESFPEENLLPSYLSSLRISGLLNLKDLNGKGLQHLTTLKALEISCCDKLRSLPEDGFPSSLSFICVKECSLLTSKFRNKRGKDWSKIAHISCIEIDEEVIS